MIKLIISEQEFYSQQDEDNLFAWLNKISEINDISGRGLDVIITIGKKISSSSLRELISIFSRYGISTKQLAVFKNSDNESWFCNPDMFWYQETFEGSV